MCMGGTAGRTTGETWDEILDGETLRRDDLGSVRAFFCFFDPLALRSSGKGFRWGNMEARDPVSFWGGDCEFVQP
jgi:hypothetical protein